MRARLATLGSVTALLALSVSVLVAASSNASRNGAIARVKDVDGRVVAIVHLSRVGDKVALAVQADGVEPADQFHGFHIHAIGKCDPKAVDPATGQPAPFFSAGGHLSPGSVTHGDHAGDLPVLLVSADGKARARVVTDRFHLSDLFDQDGSAIIIHAGSDNYANIPATTPTGGERYHSHLENVFGPDSVTKATGDAGSRFGCGVVRHS
jgi:superoxide dismutase, Cu-Zn family